MLPCHGIHSTNSNKDRGVVTKTKAETTIIVTTIGFRTTGRAAVIPGSMTANKIAGMVGITIGQEGNETAIATEITETGIDRIQTIVVMIVILVNR
mmetsp:Transcript_14692/g.40869  ORF Transcript_14692/g.40869 Transcript_14692/m.40869 type:complete len:96 (+) Transcript_14692:1362-1649(+)